MMRYNNEWWLKHRITITEAAKHLQNGKNVFALPDCGCPAPPDPEEVKSERFTTMPSMDIENYLKPRYTSFAI